MVTLASSPVVDHNALGQNSSSHAQRQAYSQQSLSNSQSVYDQSRQMTPLTYPYRARGRGDGVFKTIQHIYSHDPPSGQKLKTSSH